MKNIKMTVILLFYYIYFIKALLCTIIQKTENNGCPYISTYANPHITQVGHMLISLGRVSLKCGTGSNRWNGLPAS